MWERGLGRRATGWRIKGLLAWGACLPAPLSSHSEPGPPRQGHWLRPRAWTLALPPPPHRPSQESSVSGPDPGRREGRREEGWAVAGGPGPSPVGTSVGVGAGGGQPRPGPCLESTSPPQAAQPRSHSHLGGLYLFYFPAQPLPGGGLGAGPVLNKQIQMEPGSAAALDLPLSPLPSSPDREAGGQQGLRPSLHVPHVPCPHSSTAGSTAVPVHSGDSCWGHTGQTEGSTQICPVQKTLPLPPRLAGVWRPSHPPSP